MTGYNSGGCDQLDTSPETFEQELRPAICERRQTDLWRIIVDYRLAAALGLDHDIDLVHKPTGRRMSECADSRNRITEKYVKRDQIYVTPAAPG